MNKAPTLLSQLADHAETILLGKALEQFGALCLRDGPGGGYEVLLITTRETVDHSEGLAHQGSRAA